MKKYVIYGAGLEAEKFLYRFDELEIIDYFVDANRKGEFHQKPIYTIDNAPSDFTEHKVIV